MTDTAELIARLRERAKACPKIYSWENETHQLEWKAADALAAQAQEIERLKEQLRPDSPTERAPTQWAYDQVCASYHKYKDRAEAAEAEVKRITRMAIGDIYAEWGRRVEAAEARVRELQTVAFQAQEMAKEQCSRADAIEAQTIERMAERVDKLGEHSIARAIRALNPSSVSS